MRLIDADELKEIYSGNGTFTSAHFRTAIDEMPTIEPEQKKGKWIDARDYCGEFLCSNCHETNINNSYKYCPNCGAKMEKEQ